MMRLCLIRFVGTRKSPVTGISLGVVVNDVVADSVVGNWVVVVELWRFSHSAVAVIGFVCISLSRSESSDLVGNSHI